MTTTAAPAAEGFEVTPAPRPDEETPLSVVTLTQYQQLFRTVALGGQQANSVNFDAVMSVLDEVGVGDEWDEPNLPGMWVCSSDYRLIEALPQGSVLEWGDRADGHREWALYGVAGGLLSPLLGGFDIGSNYLARLRLRQMPGAGPVEGTWITARPDGSDDANIRDFQAQVWELVQPVKEEQDWCGVVDMILDSIGINARSSRRPTYMGPAAVAGMEEGTLLRYVTATGESAYYRRDDSSTNPARTVRLGGKLPGEWCQRMSLLSTGNQTDLRITCASTNELDGMPEGTVMFDDYGTTYTKVGRLWEHRRGGHVTARHFTSGHRLTFTQIGASA